MSAQSQLRLIPEQCLAIERKAEFKSEYHQGEMFAMAGASEPRMYTMDEHFFTVCNTRKTFVTIFPHS